MNFKEVFEKKKQTIQITDKYNKQKSKFVSLLKQDLLLVNDQNIKQDMLVFLHACLKSFEILDFYDLKTQNYFQKH